MADPVREIQLSCLCCPAKETGTEKWAPMAGMIPYAKTFFRLYQDDDGDYHFLCPACNAVAKEHLDALRKLLGHKFHTVMQSMF